MAATALRRITANGRSYALPRSAPVVGILIDGNEEAYLTAALAAGRMPHWQAITERNHGRDHAYGLVRAVMPTFTNPNNCAVVTGTPPSVNGICGNFFINEQGEEVMMNDPAFLRCGTIFAKAAEAGTPVYVATAKDKLLKLLTHGLNVPWSAPSPEAARTPCFGFSAEFANDDAAAAADAAVNARAADAEAALRACFPASAAATVPALLGSAAPPIYAPNCSVYVLESGAGMLAAHAREEGGDGDRAPPLLYLSTTDFVQHKYEPTEPEALDFYAGVDAAIGALDAMGAVIGVTADHGMNDKTQGGVGGTTPPDIVFVEELLANHSGGGGVPNTTILPITDPYVVHHGALGSFATVHLHDTAQLGLATEVLRAAPGVERVLSRAEACAEWELPPDRIGDLCVVGGRHTVLGRTPAYHDLSHVPRLRSHGGETEAWVPLLLNRPLRADGEGASWAQRLAAGELRNYDLFDLLLNGCEH